MSDRAFFDTNILIYAISQNERRAPRAEELLVVGGILSVQVLNEFVSMVRHKIRMPWKEVREALEAFRILCPSPVAITLDTHEAALRIVEKYGFGIYDALIAAAALEAKCVTLYSEDLQDGRIINDQLTIRNPFKWFRLPSTRIGIRQLLRPASRLSYSAFTAAASSIRPSRLRER